MKSEFHHLRCFVFYRESLEMFISWRKPFLLVGVS